MPTNWDRGTEPVEQRNETKVRAGGTDSGDTVQEPPSGPSNEPPDAVADVDPGEDSSGDGDESDDELPKEIEYDILKNERRRLVLRYLFENETPASLSTLSEHVAGVENDKDPRKLDSQERKRAYVGLYQCHLPRMDDAGVIDFNKDRGLVEKGTHAEQLEPHVLPDDEGQPAAVWAYLLGSVFGLGVYLVTQSPMLGVQWLGAPVLALTLVVIMAIAGEQLRRRPEEE